MQIGRFFSLQQGRVGQHLSSRVLVVRTPFRKSSKSGEASEVCYFGFDKLSQAQRFMQYLSGLGRLFQLHHRHAWLPFVYTVQLQEHADLARMLAYWDRAVIEKRSLKPINQHLRDRQNSSALLDSASLTELAA
jgi:hypothetical protein